MWKILFKVCLIGLAFQPNGRPLGGTAMRPDFDGFDSRRTAWDPMIPCYFDTGLVLKLVVKEPLSGAVLDFVSSRKFVVRGVRN